MSLELVSSLDELELRVRSLAAANSAGDVFKTLLEASRLAAPRAGVFLVRQGRLRGWGSVGYTQDVSRGLKEFSLPIDDRWARRLQATTEGAAGSDMALDFGQPAPAESVDLVLQVKSKPIAYIVLERFWQESPWMPPAFGILIAVARLRLDLDLALRRLQAGTDAPAAESPQETVPTLDRPTLAPEAVAPLVQPQPQPPQEIADIVPMRETAAADSPQLEAARRYARLVATDIRLYNEEAVMLGRRTGDLADRLGDQLGRGKEAFLRRHPDLGPLGERILHEAYVAVLAGGDANLLPASAPE